MTRPFKIIKASTIDDIKDFEYVRANSNKHKIPLVRKMILDGVKVMDIADQMHVSTAFIQKVRREIQQSYQMAWIKKNG
jgi:uncharacterized protein YerC